MAADDPTIEELVQRERQRLEVLEERVRKEWKPIVEILVAGGADAETLERALLTLAAEQARAGNIALQEDLDRILARLDAAMPKAQKEMDELLARLRTTRIVEAT